MMKYPSDYETLENLEKLQKAIVSLNAQSEERLTSAQTLQAEANRIEADLQSQRQQVQELASLLAHNRQLLDLDLQKLSSGIELLSTQTKQAEELKAQLDSLSDYVQAETRNIKNHSVEFQGKAEEINASCLNYFNQSQKVLEKVIPLSESVELKASNLEAQYQHFLKQSENFANIKSELSLLRDQHTNLAIRHKYTAIGLGGGLLVSILLAIFL